MLRMLVTMMKSTVSPDSAHTLQRHHCTNITGGRTAVVGGRDGESKQPYDTAV